MLNAVVYARRSTTLTAGLIGEFQLFMLASQVTWQDETE
jgi:hypothetical protein